MTGAESNLLSQHRTSINQLCCRLVIARIQTSQARLVPFLDGGDRKCSAKTFCSIDCLDY